MAHHEQTDDEWLESTLEEDRRDLMPAFYVMGAACVGASLLELPSADSIADVAKGVGLIALGGVFVSVAEKFRTRDLPGLRK